MVEISPDKLRQAAELIAQADALVIAAGAGMGVDSGLPDFRGREGFWRAYPALRGSDFQTIASPATFESQPDLAWGFYGHRLALYRRTAPHAGFALLRRWGESRPRGYSVFTSNVDGQFQQAGFDAQRVHECHGSIHHLQCLHGCSDDIWDASGFEPQVDETRCLLRNDPPRCPRCGALARPNILMFGDWHWNEQRWMAQAQRQNAWLSTTERPVVIEIGAGTAIATVRHFSQHLQHRHHARLIRVNPDYPEVSSPLDVSLRCGAHPALQAIDHWLR